MRALKPFSFWIGAMLWMGSVGLMGQEVPVPPLEIRQVETPYNLHKVDGVPISNNGSGFGSDGRQPQTIPPATPGQFQSFLGAGGGIHSSTNFVSNPASFGLPADPQKRVFLLRARIGSPVIRQGVSILFGAVVPKPDVDEFGIPLLETTRPEDYWFPEPFTTNAHVGARYFYSTNAEQVYAVQPGVAQVIWRRATPTNALPSGFTGTGDPNIFTNTNPQVVTRVVKEGDFFFFLLPKRYLFSGSPVKPPRTIYWTESVFRQTGWPVEVPSTRVSGVNIVYNDRVPERVPEAFQPAGEVPIIESDGTNVLDETRTIWHDRNQNAILSFNREGRVFMELLGDERANGARQQLGVEIVDIIQAPTPVDLEMQLGDRVDAYQDGRDDSFLYPEPVRQTVVQDFAYRHSFDGGTRISYFAEKETRNKNDLLIHWLEQGVEGLFWPHHFARYRLVWPDNVERYQQYIRPLVSNEPEAQATAVSLPTDNTPVIAYQDPLDRPRAKLTPQFEYFTFLEPAFPAHRGLIRLISGENLRYERVFSWLSPNLVATNFLGAAGTVATNLTAWNTNTLVFEWPDELKAPRVFNQTVEVGARINPPVGELGSAGGDDFLAGHIVVEEGNSFHPAYADPLSAGFDVANQGSIIPVNAIPGQDRMEIWWFRKSERADDFIRGFKPVFWPSAIGRYTLVWPSSPQEIVLASNDGSGGLGSLEAGGKIYAQNNPALAGYNPNEEHGLMLGGQAYALRSDLNLTATTIPAVLDQTWSSEPFVLLEFTDSDGRTSITPFKVLSEKPEEGILFDYLSDAGSLLQAPMPLPFLAPPVEILTNVVQAGGVRTTNFVSTNYNSEVLSETGDIPDWWDSVADKGDLAHYNSFTYKDRKNNFWVYRGRHAGPPPLQAGKFNPVTGNFDALPQAKAIAGQEFEYHLHVSRRLDALTVGLAQPDFALPPGLKFVTTNGIAIAGIPTVAGNTNLSIVITDTDDGSRVTNSLALLTELEGSVITQAPLSIVSTNQFVGDNVTYTGRPPYLAEPPGPTNSFTMRYFYKTQEGFAWPNHPDAPEVGAIVPYLRAPDDTTLGDSSSSKARDIVYRPVWPVGTPVMSFGQTLTKPVDGLPAVLGNTSVEVLYQQSLSSATNNFSVVLHDPLREKSKSLGDVGLEILPPSIATDLFQGKVFFPNLPPHLSERVFFDAGRSEFGDLVVRGEFRDETVGDDYILLNVLKGTDLQEVIDLVPGSDTANRGKWESLVNGLVTPVEKFIENPQVPGTYIVGSSREIAVDDLAEVLDDDEAVDEYALSARGPGQGFVTLIAGNGEAFTPEGDPVAVQILRLQGELYTGEIKVIASPNPLSEKVTFQHTADLGGNFADYQYEWRKAPSVGGTGPASPAGFQPLFLGEDHPRHIFGGSGIEALVDNFLIMRYRPINPAHPLFVDKPVEELTDDDWSEWTEQQLAEGWIKRVLAGINPFNQRVDDLFNNAVNTDVSLITQAGTRWEGDIALNLDNINDTGLIEIYETVLNRGKLLSIDAGINFGPANDALLLAAGYINDLYMMLGNEALADASNPTIGIGTQDEALGDIATALFSFKGQVPSLLEEELALLRGRDDFLLPNVELSPFYNRLIWNYTRGIDSGEVVYALNYNIQENPNGESDGIVNAEDAAHLYPQGHGDAYGHYLTALKGYYKLLANSDFDWVPRIEAVLVLGAPVQVDYLDERKFASAAAAVARTGKQVFDLTWRRDYDPGANVGWESFEEVRENDRREFDDNGNSTKTKRHWGLDHWAVRTGQGAYLNWVIGNAILPTEDPDPNHEGIQVVDRQTVPELTEIPIIYSALQTDMDNAEGQLSPLGLPQNAIAFDLDPNQVTGPDSQTHFEQVFERARAALKNAVVSFDDTKDVTRLLRSEQNDLVSFQFEVANQELAFTNALIELYGTPYPDDIGPGKRFPTGYEGPDDTHYMYVETPEMDFGGTLTVSESRTYRIDIQQFPADWQDRLLTNFDFNVDGSSTSYREDLHFIEFEQGPHGFFSKPASFTGRRKSPGQIQQAISEFIAAHYRLADALRVAEELKGDLDKAVQILNARRDVNDEITRLQQDLLIARETLMAVQFATETVRHGLDSTRSFIADNAEAIAEFVPQNFIAGLAAGGDVASAGRGAIHVASAIAQAALAIADFQAFFAERGLRFAVESNEMWVQFGGIEPLQFDQEMREAVVEVGNDLSAIQSQLAVINERLRGLDDARRQVDTLIAKGDRMVAEHNVFRKRAAAVIQGFRTRDVGFRIFRNEKLERFNALFDLAARYTLLAANAYDYETGLLDTQDGRDFVSRIVGSRALGVVLDGQPQFAGSNTGDPGLSSVLAEMKADWDVLRSRLGFNNPDGYGTTVSLRSENFRILPGAEGDANWRDVLQRGRMGNILDDPDVRRYCLQVDAGNGLPVPGIVIDFSTVVGRGVNLFGKELAGGDHAFPVSSFATKIFAAGLALEGYQGMDDPLANGSAVSGSGSSSPGDPDLGFLDPTALSANPHIYLIPVGVDSMRSPPLGDAAEVRSWAVQDVTIPMPFNIGGSEMNTLKLFQSDDSLSEPLFSIRKHQAFRPVSSAAIFGQLPVFNDVGGLSVNPYTNRRLIGRSVWNSRWKIVIPGETLLSNPTEGLDRFLRTVKDIKIHLVTYSYAGN